MKSLTVFLQKVLEESGTWCDISTERDQKTISSRVEKEGFSFLTITLPTFGKDLEIALDRGYVDSDLWKSFHNSRGSRLPAFLQGFTSRIFDTNSGQLLDDPDRIAIYVLRQCTYLFKKIEVDCSDRRIRKAINAYIKCEQEMGDLHTPWKATLDLMSIHPYMEYVPEVVTYGPQVKPMLEGTSYNVGDDVRSFLDLALCFGVIYSEGLHVLWIPSNSLQNMVTVPPLTGFTETRSLFRLNGPIGWNPATFLMEGTLSVVGVTLTLTMSVSSNLGRRGL